MIIQVEGLVKEYGSFRAVDGVSFEVEEGEIFGIVGPNGAGKTTTVECLIGLRQPTQGRLSVLGLDPQKDRYALRERIGVQLQAATLPSQMKVREALTFFASFYERTNPALPSLLDLVGLAEKRDRYLQGLSGGEKQRLFIALALVNDPQVIFLDELTTGLDPRGRRHMWSVVENLKQQGKTILLTTHFMEEMQRLADRVAVLSGGKILALGTPQELIARYGGSPRLVLHLHPGQDPDRLLPGRAWEKVQTEEEAPLQAILPLQDMREAAQVLHELLQTDTDFQSLQLQQPSMEDVYLNLTGKPLEVEA
ncbi:MAG: ABC transporter ATP-binding protein [Bacillota bacterium]|nr:ABC transporter ATP-binding protein [Bacillota bacterium]